MNDTVSASPDLASVHSALSWLGTPSASDPLEDLVPLRNHLSAVADGPLPNKHWHPLLDLFRTRANGITDALRPLLHEATLPLARRLRNIAQGLIEIHGTLARGYLQAATEAQEFHQAKPLDVSAICAQSLHHLALQYEVALLIAAPAPENLWHHTYQAAHLLAATTPPVATLPPSTIAADRNLKRILALAAAQPESFTAQEIAFLTAYLRKFAVTVEIRPATPEAINEWHWLQEGRDLPPVAAARRPPPASKPLIFFSCAALARRAGDHRMRLDAGESQFDIDLPAGLAAEDCRNVLARAESRWSSPPKRQFHRRRHSYRVQVCTQLVPLWQLLRGDAESMADDSLPVTDWMVLNESPGGYAIMHVAGDVTGLAAGTVLGLRAGPGPWNVCLVRWARSDNPEHVELGLELVAPTAEPVWVVRAGSLPRQPVAALLLPPLPRLDRSEAILTPRGHYAQGTFTLMGERDGKIQLTSCLTGRLAMQTAGAEVFEFDRDAAGL